MRVPLGWLREFVAVQVEPARLAEDLTAAGLAVDAIETAEPVASRTISRRGASALSAASIRNVMADLVEEGYLTQPHTSAGRVPTEKAFRVFAQDLAVRNPSAAALQLVQAALPGVNRDNRALALYIEPGMIAKWPFPKQVFLRINKTFNDDVCVMGYFNILSNTFYKFHSLFS